ncbi:MAG: hypothetical protein V4635_05240 [Bacteroidota bacterium]
MPGIIKISIALLIIQLLFSGCKKGEDDPLISFRTRKARVVGNWTMKEGKIYSSNTLGDITTISNTQIHENTYDGETEQFNAGVSVGTSTFTGTRHTTFKFERNGNFKSEQTFGTGTTILTGTWNFTNGVGKHKNKEQIVITKLSVNYNGSSSASAGNKPYYTYNIKELRNKKIVLVAESSENQNAYQERIYNEEYSFEQ